MKRKKLKIRDLFFVALYGVRARKGRATLTSIGIGIGIAAIVAVSGISASGRADLLSTLESLGTNLIKASPQAGSEHKKIFQKVFWEWLKESVQFKKLPPQHRRIF